MSSTDNDTSDEETDQDLSEDAAGQATTSALPAKKYEPSWSGVGQLLTDSDLDSPAARKMLVNELSRLTRDNETLADYREKFHKADKQCEVYSERLQNSSTLSAQSALIVSIGSILAGVGTSQIYASAQPSSTLMPGGGWLGTALLLIGVVCVFIPVISLWVKR